MISATQRAFSAFYAERYRQVASCGFDREGDDGYTNGELAGAAACYALNGMSYKLQNFSLPSSTSKVMRAAVEEVRKKTNNNETTRAALKMLQDKEEAVLGPRPPRLWPWHRKWWKPSPDNRKRDIEKAVALLCAEWERIDRMEVAR